MLRLDRSLHETMPIGPEEMQKTGTARADQGTAQSAFGSLESERIDRQMTDRLDNLRKQAALFGFQFSARRSNC
jgi:hypothetical protein